MQNLWNDLEANKIENNPLDLRVYSSRLLGSEPSLVLHGGGNTSVKIMVTNFFGETEHLLYVKGSGWDLATIERAGFSGVKMDVLLKMSKLKTLTDSDMVKYQKAAMVDPVMPAPSVEAILHAIIPYTFVDHTHSDAVVALTNSPNGPEIIKEILGKRFIYIPYVMPGFILAKTVAEHTQTIQWSNFDGILLQHHGIFTFADTAKKSYELMIESVSKVEDYIQSKNAFDCAKAKPQSYSLLQRVQLRKAVSDLAHSAQIMLELNNEVAAGFVQSEKLIKCSQQGTLTPDHILNLKRTPLIVENNINESVENFGKNYTDYFNRHSVMFKNLKILDQAPRWALVPNQGAFSFGSSLKKAQIVQDLAKHTLKGWNWAENLGGWKSLSEQDLFEVEYWELEQAKLKVQSTAALSLQGKIALVTGAASGIGKACVESLIKQGAVVAALDISPNILNVFKNTAILPIQCDLTKPNEIRFALEKLISNFGGLDIVVSNAGTFPPGKNISEIESQDWQKIIEVNLNSHQYVLKESLPYLEYGIDPTVIFIASKNVKAPGPGVSAYSAAKAALTQLARVAALELGAKGIRVNTIHPNAVFDTGIWSPEALENRAKHYKMSVDEYKKNNLLKIEITSHDIAALVCSMAGPIYKTITGAQINIDGGNDRTI